MSTYRAVNGEYSPVVICDDDEPGTVLAMAGRQEDVEMIAAALNFADERDALRLLLENVGARLNDYEPGSAFVIEINEWIDRLALSSPRKEATE